MAIQTTGQGAIRKSLPKFTRHRGLMIGLTIFVALVLAVLAAPILAQADPDFQDAMATFSPPNLAHPMGTDAFGRDMMARVLWGGRVTMVASLAVVVIGALIGTTLGLIAGYFQGIAGFVIMRLVDLLLAFPGILLALAVTAILGPGIENGVIAISIILVPIYVRLVEGATVQVRALPFVDAATTLGAGPLRIILTHVLPNVLSSVIVMTTSWLGIAALWITALGFIGLGVQPPQSEWGAILNDGQMFLTLAWWMTVFPGLFLALFVVSVNMIGDGLRDVLDPIIRD
jgi:ABC-type dipeptide/oligopeptide/nickel transport system permease subunit